jgi:predicted DNA-binding ribbon-helix-helix protein
MLGHRLQVLLDESRYEKLARVAARRGTSIGAVIREAIDNFDEGTEKRHEAIAAILAVEPMEVPADPADLRRELDEARGRSR